MIKKQKEQTESGIFKELERVCRIIADQKVDDKDIVFIRQQIKQALGRVDSIRDAKEVKAEKRKRLTALNKRLTEIDNEIVRLYRISGTEKMILRMQLEKEKVNEQIKEVG